MQELHIGKNIFQYGLPRALTKKVQETLREKHNGIISYNYLTYRDLISKIKKEGLKLCSQLRLKCKVKKYLKASRKYLGYLCVQYGIEMSVPPSHKHNISKYFHKRKSYSNKDYSKIKYRKDKYYKSNKTPQNPTKPHKRQIRCFKRGQKMTYSPKLYKTKNICFV